MTATSPAGGARLDDLVARLPAPPLLRVHRSFAVNLDRARQIRRRPSGDWELRLDPPVNKLLPVARSRTKVLFRTIE